jgi:DNA transformation protein
MYPRYSRPFGFASGPARRNGLLFADKGEKDFRAHDSGTMSFLSSSQKALVDRIGEVVEDVEARMMFGTVGLFADDQQFGVLDGEDLYLSVDEDVRSDFAAAGAEPYNASAVEKAAYLEVPDEVVQNDEAFTTWLEHAVEAA